MEEKVRVATTPRFASTPRSVARTCRVNGEDGTASRLAAVERLPDRGETAECAKVARSKSASREMRVEHG